MTATPRARALLGAAIPLAALAALDGYAGWRFLLFAVLAALGLGWLWAHDLQQGLSIEREMRFGWAHVGDLLEERFTLRHTGRLPALWVEVQDGSTLPGYRAGLVTGIGPGESSRWRSSGVCQRRGLFTLGPTRLLAADPLGLFAVRLDDPRCVQLMVTPPVAPLPQVEVAPGGRAGAGRPRRSAPERTVSADGVRQYVPGDSLRWVHWRTTARRAEPFVRTFESLPSGDWWIVLDLNRRVQAGQGARSTAEHGVILAASLADRGLRRSRAVGLAANGQPFAWLPPRQGDDQRWQILRTLALVEPGERPLAELLARLQGALAGGSSLVLITPDRDGAWLEALLPLTWKGIVPTVLYLDPAGFDGAAAPTAADAAAHSPGPPVVDPLAGELAQHGIQYLHIIPELLKRSIIPAGERDWRWRVTPSGRAVTANPAQDLSWRQV
ncbi:MAG: DUF58 domain-containing protein [Chloroflexota bacterium]